MATAASYASGWPRASAGASHPLSSSGITGAARRRRQQRQRADARHVQWLVSLLQAAGAHHTGASAVPGAEVVAQIASLQHRLGELQEEVTMLKAILYVEGGTIGDSRDEWQPPSTESAPGGTSPVLPAAAAVQHVLDSGCVDDDDMDTSTYPADADAESHPRHGFPGLLPVG